MCVFICVGSKRAAVVTVLPPLQLLPTKTLCNKLVFTPMAPYGVSLAPAAFRAAMVDIASVPIPLGAKLFVYIDDLLVVYPPGVDN